MNILCPTFYNFLQRLILLLSLLKNTEPYSIPILNSIFSNLQINPFTFFQITTILLVLETKSVASCMRNGINSSGFLERDAKLDEEIGC